MPEGHRSLYRHHTEIPRQHDAILYNPGHSQGIKEGFDQAEAFPEEFVHMVEHPTAPQSYYLIPKTWWIEQGRASQRNLALFLSWTSSQLASFDPASVMEYTLEEVEDTSPKRLSTGELIDEIKFLRQIVTDAKILARNSGEIMNALEDELVTLLKTNEKAVHNAGLTRFHINRLSTLFRSRQFQENMARLRVKLRELQGDKTER